jgi:hypothetical protein
MLLKHPYPDFGLLDQWAFGIVIQNFCKEIKGFTIIFPGISEMNIDQSHVEKGFGFFKSARGQGKNLLVLPEGAFEILLVKKLLTPVEIFPDFDSLLYILNGRAV